MKNIFNKILLLSLSVLLLSNCQTEAPNFLEESQEDFDERMSWWRDASFGMFIHWGAYAVPAGVYQGEDIPGIGEWIMDRAKIPVEEYEKFVAQFNPTQFNARDWAKIAKDAGMKYIVITSKHHDGFCLWDSKISKYDVIDAAPINRNLLKELAKACKKEGIRLCFYHSIMDWHHPDAKKENFEKYREEYLIPQLEELLSGKYGDVGVLWFDGEWISEWTEEQGKELYQHLRSIKPDLIINNRVGKGRQGMQGMNKDRSYAGDFGTPEQEILHGASDLDWESCMTMNDTWGFKKNDHNWKSAEMLIHNLVDIIAKGGNYLLNVGPTAEGLIPQPSIERLAEMGEWIRVNEEAVYQTKRFEHYKEGEEIRYIMSANEEDVYAVALEWPGDKLTLRYAEPTEGSAITLLGYEGDLEWTYSPQKGLIINLPDGIQDPENRPCNYAWVFKMQASPAGVVTLPLVKSGDKENPETVVFFKQVSFTIESSPGSTVHYTMDGTDPLTSSMPYSSPVMISSSMTLTARAFEDGKMPSEIVNVRFVQSSKYSVAGTTTTPDARYPGQGMNGFLSYGDGIRGSVSDFRDGNWLGFEGVDMEVALELPETKSIKRIEAGFLQDIGSWIMLPKQVDFFVSNDGISYQKVGLMSHETKASDKEKKVENIGVDVNGKRAKFIKIVAENIGVCPDWHPGAGGLPWVFCDEIIIE